MDLPVPPDLLALARVCADVDGVEPFNEATRIALNAGDVPRVAREQEGVAAAVGFADAPVEVAVHPDHRRRGHGADLVRELLEAGETQFWAHGDLPPARATAAACGLAAVRTLLVLRLSLGEQAPREQVPDGVTLRAFDEADADAIVAINARAFADHPEQGAMDRADFDRRRQEAWFDPAGLFVAERDGEVVGFHWTKIDRSTGSGNDPSLPHSLRSREVPPSSGNESTGSGTGSAVGEVYVVGVDPDAHGGGLGTALTARGLRHMHEQGVRTVDLYVEGDNQPALAVYERLGFVEHARDVLYALR